MGRFCKNCGTENSEETGFCVNCGTPLGTAMEQGYEQAYQQNEQQVYQQDMQQPYQQVAPQNLSVSNLGANDMFVSADEYVVATLKNGLASNIMSGEGLRKEKAILTNRRLYYNHKDGLINVMREEEKIDVVDITGTKILDCNPRGWLVLAALILVIGLLGALAAGEGGLLLSAIVSAIVPLVIYFALVKKHLRIEYSGGFIYFSVKQYNMKSVREFQKAIYMVKDSWR